MDDDAEKIRHLVRLLRGFHEDQVIAEAETSLTEAPAVTDVPMPNTTHPAYAHLDPQSWERFGDTVLVARPERTWAAENPMEVSAMPRTNMLTQRKATGAAPYVARWPGDVAAYFWPVWVDSAGRYVAGDAELVRR
jgi:hypothetical protein